MRNLRLLPILLSALLLTGFESRDWNGTTYSIPESGDRNWADLTDFLVDLAESAQTTNFQKVGVRVATTTPVTVSADTDHIVITALAAPGAVAVNLPAGVTGQTFMVVDGTGDAATNNITIDGDGSEQINGANTYVINVDNAGVLLVYNGSAWTVVSEFVSSSSGTGTIARNKIAAGTADHVVINDGSGNLSSEATLAKSRGGAAADMSSVTFPSTGTIVTRDASETLTNKTLTSPVVTGGAFAGPVLDLPQINDTSDDHQYIFSPSELGADRTITLPLLLGNDDLVLEDHTQVLANKTLSFAQFHDTSSDHQYVLLVNELSADRNVTLPLLTGDDTFAMLAATQTFTNKTLTSPTINTPTVTGGAFSAPVLDLPQINDTSDDHQYVFAVNELAADRTVTWPLLGGNDTIAMLDHTQTFTNKTLTAPAISSPTVSGNLLLQNAAGSAPTLELSEDPDNGTDSVTIQATASLAGDYTLTLPVDDGASGEALTTNGSGVLAWSAVATDALSEQHIKVGNAGTAAAVDTAAVGDILADDTGGLTYKADSIVSADIDDDVIVNADINSAAAIAGSKIVSASASVSGVVTTSAQTFAGSKTFEGDNLATIFADTDTALVAGSGIANLRVTSADTDNTGGIASEIRTVSDSATGATTRIDFYYADSGTNARRAFLSGGATPYFTIASTDTVEATNEEVAALIFTSADADNTQTDDISAKIEINALTDGSGGYYRFEATTAGTLGSLGTWSGTGGLNTNGVGGASDSDDIIPVSGRDTNATATSAHAVAIMEYDSDNDATGARFISFQDSGGQIGRIEAASATTVAYQTSSDERLKYDFRDLTGALDIVNKTKPSRFKWKETGADDIGFGAQSLKAVYPNVVSGGEDLVNNPMAVDYGKLTPLLTAAIQELSQQVEDLKAEIALLKSTPNDQGVVTPIKKTKTASLMPNFKKAANP